MVQPLVAVTTDVNAYEGYRWHAAPETYLDAALSVAGVFPVTVPSMGADRLDLDRLLQCVDGVLLTGSKSNVDPERYGETRTRENGPYDPARDATALPLIRKAIASGVPVLAICRGMQELNVALGGTLASELQEMPGNLDHRAPKSDRQDGRYAIYQKVDLAEDGCLATLLGEGPIEVNSLHRQGIGRLADDLAVEARAPDGVIEAVSVKRARAFAVGVQWHPEYWVRTDLPSARLFKAFGEAVRAHFAARSGSQAASVNGDVTRARPARPSTGGHEVAGGSTADRT